MSPERRRAVDPEDEKLVALMAGALEPRAMDGAEARAFEARIRRRLARGTGPSRLGAFAVAMAAAAAWILWFAKPSEMASPVPAVATREERAPLERREEAPVVAFAESDGDDLDAPDVTPEDYLPDDYLVLAGLFGDEDGHW